jgi:hypothetical protein
MDLDAFRLVGPGTRFTMQLRMLDRDGRPVTRFIRFTNIEAQNVRFVYEGEALPLDQLPNSIDVWASGVIQIEKNDSGLPASLRFQVEDAETGEVLTSDDFGLFLFEYLPNTAGFTFNLVTPVNAILPVSDPVPPDPNDPTNPPDPNDPNNPGDPNGPNNPGDPNDPNNPTDPNDPNNPTDPNNPNDPGDPLNEVPEPATYALVGFFLLQAVIWSRYSTRRAT